MMLIDFAFHSALPTPDVNFAKVDDTTLRYYCFIGNQILIINGADFSARGAWVPLLDFAAALVYVCGVLGRVCKLTF